MRLSDISPLAKARRASETNNSRLVEKVGKCGEKWERILTLRRKERRNPGRPGNEGPSYAKAMEDVQ